MQGNKVTTLKKWFCHFFSSDTREDSEHFSGLNQLEVENTVINSNLAFTASIKSELITSRLCLCMQNTNLYADVKENGEFFKCLRI